MWFKLSFDDEDRLELVDEPVELLRDKMGKGQRVRAYPLPQLLLRLNPQNDFELCFSSVSGTGNLESSAFSWCACGGGGGGRDDAGLICGGVAVFLIWVGRILPLEKSSSAMEGC